MSHQPRSYSLPVNPSLPERQRKPRGSIFRRLARAIRKKRTQSDLAATGASWTISESPQPLTPSTSLDSLDDLLQATSSSQAEALTSAEPFLEILKEVKPLLQCIQSSNKTSQNRVGALRHYWESKMQNSDSPMWDLMKRELTLLHEYHVGQGKELDNVLSNLEWLQA